MPVTIAQPSDKTPDPDFAATLAAAEAGRRAAEEEEMWRLFLTSL